MVHVSDDGHVADVRPLVHDLTNLREDHKGGRGRGRKRNDWVQEKRSKPRRGGKRR